MTLGSGMVSASALQTPIMVRRDERDEGEEGEGDVNQASTRNIWLSSETISVAFSLTFTSLLSQVVMEKMKSEGVSLSRKWKLMIFILLNTGQINTTLQNLCSGLRILLMVCKNYNSCFEYMYVHNMWLRNMKQTNKSSEAVCFISQKIKSCWVQVIALLCLLRQTWPVL